MALTLNDIKNIVEEKENLVYTTFSPDNSDSIYRISSGGNATPLSVAYAAIVKKMDHESFWTILCWAFLEESRYRYKRDIKGPRYYMGVLDLLYGPECEDDSEPQFNGTFLMKLLSKIDCVSYNQYRYYLTEPFIAAMIAAGSSLCIKSHRFRISNSSFEGSGPWLLDATVLDILLSASPKAIELQKYLETISTIDKLPKRLMPIHLVVFDEIYKQSDCFKKTLLQIIISNISLPNSIISIITDYHETAPIEEFSGQVRTQQFWKNFKDLISLIHEKRTEEIASFKETAASRKFTNKMKQTIEALTELYEQKGIKIEPESCNQLVSSLTSPSILCLYKNQRQLKKIAAEEISKISISIGMGACAIGYTLFKGYQFFKGKNGVK